MRQPEINEYQEGLSILPSADRDFAHSECNACKKDMKDIIAEILPDPNMSEVVKYRMRVGARYDTTQFGYGRP
jgi:hypothetical protein